MWMFLSFYAFSIYEQTNYKAPITGDSPKWKCMKQCSQNTLPLNFLTPMPSLESQVMTSGVISSFLHCKLFTCLYSERVFCEQCFPNNIQESLFCYYTYLIYTEYYMICNHLHRKIIHHFHISANMFRKFYCKLLLITSFCSVCKVFYSMTCQ